MRINWQLVVSGIAGLVFVCGLLAVNIYFGGHLHKGCKSWECIYQATGVDIEHNCTFYIIKTMNGAKLCETCMHSIPKSPTTCYNDGSDTTCPLSDRCANDFSRKMMLILNGIIGAAFLVFVILTIVGRNQSDYERVE